MPTYQDFINRLLPGKYALTKSMELTKVTTSGTLWYTKKFVVLYYFVFLSNDIETRAYINKAIRYFDGYIETLDPAVQESARAFFYPDIDAINLKSEHFTVFSVFAGRNDFRNQEEKTEYYQRAKKSYFTLLMDSGGQKGVKKYVKEALQEEGFLYSAAEVERRILDGAVYTAVQECNEGHRIADRSIKYILSQEAVDGIEALARAGQHLTVANVREIVAAHPHERPGYYAIENDMAAFIRNERQILYYYGFFHSKSSGAADYEFSSLTPVGEAALRANAIEFQAIWEHQKIKMISQPATADIQNITGLQVSPDRFAISYTPYLNILHHLVRHHSLTLEQYKYIVSREDRFFPDTEWQEIEDEVLGNIEDVKARIASFGRKGDTRDEDFRKELLKYLLGIRGDLPKDQGSNNLAFCSFRGKTVAAEDADKLLQVYSVYSKLNDYKAQKYSPLFLRCEEDLRRRYAGAIAGNTTPIDSRIKIDWDLYNIHIDKFILLGVLLVLSAFSVGIQDIENLSRGDVERICTFLRENCSSVLQFLGLRSAVATQRELNRAINALASEDYTMYIETVEDQTVVRARYRGDTTEALLHRIREMSAMATVTQEEGRARNMTLVSCLKSYYMARFTENDTMKCECCGEETFLTEAGEPYVEFHHLIPFNLAFGPDHYLNLFALCPNCHRKIHFLRADYKHALYERLNDNNYLHIQFTERLRSLKTEHLLRSYHLEYLLADQAITQAEYDAVVA